MYMYTVHSMYMYMYIIIYMYMYSMYRVYVLTYAHMFFFHSDVGVTWIAPSSLGFFRTSNASPVF